MTRDELIDAGSQAMHDTFDRPGTATNREYAAAVVEAIEPLIRADEREKMKRELWPMVGAAEADVRADLRAKVEALASLQMRRPDDVYDRYCLLRDVLALLDGAE